VHERIDTETQRAAQLFMAKVVSLYDVKRGILFGSRARKSHREDSDLDIAVLLSGAQGPFLATKLAMADVAFDVLLETGIRVQPLPVWEHEWRNPENYSNPQLLRNIAKEGLEL
jgi:predicted nucleotidyltransferase